MNEIYLKNDSKDLPFNIQSNNKNNINYKDLYKVSNIENPKSYLETENRKLREKIATKEKELIQKDKIIRELKDKISKLETENRNLKRNSNEPINTFDINGNLILSPYNNNQNNNRSNNQRSIVSIINSNDSNNIRSVFSDNKKNNSTNVNLESNRNNSLRSPNSEFNIIRANNKYNRGNNNNQLNPSINDYGLFPFMNDGINYDLEFPDLLVNPIPDFTQEYIDPVREVEDAIINEMCPNPDQMTYEQLLEFQDQVGYVEKGFTKNEIQRLPKIKYSKSKFKSHDEKCTVCQYDFTENETIRKLTCGHLYHIECVDEWLSKDKKCPVCKKETRI